MWLGYAVCPRPVQTGYEDDRHVAMLTSSYEVIPVCSGCGLSLSVSASRDSDKWLIEMPVIQEDPYRE